MVVRCLTFELSWHRRWDARARLAKMYTVPPTGPAWPAVGAQLERGVRLHRSATDKQCAMCLLLNQAKHAVILAGD